jgi:hypothetical protein
MKKSSLLTALFWTIGLVMLAGNLLLAGDAVAQMEALSDADMNEITAQAGISLAFNDTLGIDLSMDTLYYGDEDGVNGVGSAGYISLTGINMQGSIAFHNPMTIDVATQAEANGMTRMTAVNLKMDGMTVKIDKLDIDAIRLGSAPGTGNSLGSIGIRNMVANMTGSISISAH